MLQRVLYVDDDDALRELAELVLGAAGIEVLACESADAALAVADAFAPQLLLLDKEMPQMDGPATLTALRSLPACSAVPAFFLTAETDPASVQQLQSAGAQAVLAKPIDPSSIVAELRARYEAAVGASSTGSGSP